MKIKSLICCVFAFGLLAGASACSSAPSTDIGNTGVGQFTLPTVAADLPGNNQAAVTDKEEVVYALLGFDGKVDSAYAVNHFKLASSGYFVDHGNYTNVINLSNTYPLTLEGNDIAIAAQKGDYYYQGDISNLALPWNIEIKYSLDEQPVSAADASTLAGKSGRLKIDITTARDFDVDSSFYQNYTLQISLTIDASKSSNIDAPDATIAAAGGNRQLTYTVLPDSDGKLSFAADVVDFEMPGISIAAVPFSMNFEAPDTSAISGDMNQLVTAISDLNNGVYGLNDGAGRLSGGASELAGAAGQVSGGAAAFGGGLTAIEQAADQAASGAEAFGQGLSAASAGSQGLVSGSSAFKSGLDQLDPIVTDLATKIATIQTSDLDPVTKAELIGLITGVNGLSSGYASIDTGIQQYTGGVDLLAQQYAAISTGMRQLSGGVSSLAQQYAALAGGLAQLAGGAQQLSSGMQELNAGTQVLAYGTSELYGGVREMPQTMQSQIDEFVAQYDFSGFEPHSFLSANNPKVSLVQFVIKSPDIELPSNAAAANEVPAELSFFDRLLALFG